jgi:hypothetical protein
VRVPKLNFGRERSVRVVASFLLFAPACFSPNTTEGLDGGGPDGSVCTFVCQDAGADLPPLVVVENILGQVCAQDGCHLSGQAGLAISNGNDFSNLIDVPSSEVPSLVRVKPGDPTQSYLYRKLACEGGIDGSCMPPGSVRLAPAIIEAFHNWIEGGAPTQ